MEDFMKVTKKILILFLIIIAFSILLPTYSPIASASGVKKNITLEKGDRYKIPLSMRNKYKYKSYNKKIAAVTRKGIVKAKKIGNTKIKAISKKNRKKYFVYKIKVKDSAIEEPQSPEPSPEPQYREPGPIGGIVVDYDGTLVELRHTDDGRYMFTIELSARYRNINNEIKYACVTVDSINKSYDEYRIGDAVACGMDSTYLAKPKTVVGDTIYLEAWFVISNIQI